MNHMQTKKNGRGQKGSLARGGALCAVLGLGSGCLLMADGTPPSADGGIKTAAGALQQLARITGQTWLVRYHREQPGAVLPEGAAVLERQGDQPGAALDAPQLLDSAAERFAKTYGAIFGLRAGDTLEHVGASHSDALGMLHVALQQHRWGLPVLGGGLVVHLDRQGSVRRVVGRIVPLVPGGAPGQTAPPDPEAQDGGGQQDGGAATITPAVSDETARQRALDVVLADEPGASLSALKPKLYVVATPGQPEQPHLAWRVEVSGQGPDLPVSRALLVDAEATDSGVLASEQRLEFLDLPVAVTGSGVGALGDERALAITQSGTKYTLMDQGRGRTRTNTIQAGQKLPGRTVSSTQADSWDTDGPAAGLAVDVHAHLATIWDYFAAQHRRFGWAGDGHGPEAVVHYGMAPGVPGMFDGRRLLFGDGDGWDWLPAGAALEVVAHEYSHGVLRSMADLSGAAETAAIEEGLADVLACAVKQSISASERPGSGDWTIGETIYRPGGQMTPIRDLADPHGTGQAAQIAEFRPGDPADDDARREQVAFNAGIVSHAGYQLAVSLGAPQTAALIYRAAEHYLRRDAGMLDAADAVLCAAKDLHGEQGAAAQAVRQAWAALGLGTVETAGDKVAP